MKITFKLVEISDDKNDGINVSTKTLKEDIILSPLFLYNKEDVVELNGEFYRIDERIITSDCDIIYEVTPYKKSRHYFINHHMYEESKPAVASD